MNGWGAAVGELLKMINTLLGRRHKRQDDPEEKQRELERKIDADILRGDETAVNERLDDTLSRLRHRRERMRERAEQEGGDHPGGS
jgi:hypothetical protein